MFLRRQGHQNIDIFDPRIDTKHQNAGTSVILTPRAVIRAPKHHNTMAPRHTIYNIYNIQYTIYNIQYTIPSRARPFRTTGTISTLCGDNPKWTKIYDFDTMAPNCRYITITYYLQYKTYVSATPTTPKYQYFRSQNRHKTPKCRHIGPPGTKSCHHGTKTS